MAMKMIMKRLVLLVGAAIGLCAASAVTAEPRDSVDRGTRMDTDAIRDDVRTNRLQIPEHPITAGQPPQPAPISKGKTKSKKSAGNSH
jgi:hypothetical protein